jgi:hypothetical protein
VSGDRQRHVWKPMFFLLHQVDFAAKMRKPFSKFNLEVCSYEKNGYLIWLFLVFSLLITKFGAS